MARLFVAVWPSAAVLDAVASVERPADAGLRWTTPGQWHVTLRFLGEADVDEAAAAVARVEHPAVRATMGPGVQVLGRTAVAATVSGLESLAAEVARATAAVGEAPEERQFRGHLTLARVKQARYDRPPREVPVVSWDVAEIALVRSTLTPTGARYDDVARVVLARPG